MSYTVTLQQRIQQLKKAQANVPEILRRTAKQATLRAIEAAQEATPPKAGRLPGTHTVTGELKQHWPTDSNAEPVVTGAKYETLLANNKDYASYVNNGHRMDRHFVPGFTSTKMGSSTMIPVPRLAWWWAPRPNTSRASS